MTGILMPATRYAPPLAANFPNLYDGGDVDPVLTDTDQGLLVAFGAGVISNNTFYQKGATKAKATGDHSIIMRVQTHSLQGFCRGGILLTDGTKSAMWSYGLSSDGSYGVQLDEWNPFGTFSATLIDNFKVHPRCEWLRCDIISGHPKDFFYSHNGINWLKVYDTTLSAFFTFTEVGVNICHDRQSGGQFPISGTDQSFVNVLYYADGDIVPGF